MRSLNELSPGEKGKISHFTNAEVSLRLMEMGCLPGEEIVFQKVAPLGCPIAIEVSGYMLSLRRSEASTIIVR